MCRITVIHNGVKSHQTLSIGLESMANQIEGGGYAADGTPDGCGVTVDIDNKFFASLPEMKNSGIDFEKGNFAVASVMLPKDEEQAKIFKNLFAEKLKKHLGVNESELFYRNIARDNSVLTQSARDTEPEQFHIFFNKPEGLNHKEFEQVIMKAQYDFQMDFETAKSDGIITSGALASFSSKFLTYKGLVHADRIDSYFTDLSSNLTEEKPAIYQSKTFSGQIRYSTASSVTWDKTHEFENILTHNGEINSADTLTNWLEEYEKEINGRDVRIVRGSDTQRKAYDFLRAASQGKDMDTEIMLSVPAQFWLKDTDPKLAAFYEYNSHDRVKVSGPAFFIVKDRLEDKIYFVKEPGGFRPGVSEKFKDPKNAANEITYYGSEFGTITSLGKPFAKDRVEAGGMHELDIAKGNITKTEEIQKRVLEREEAIHGDFSELNEKRLIKLEQKSKPIDIPFHPIYRSSPESLMRAYGITNDFIKLFIKPSSEEGKDAKGAMHHHNPESGFSKFPKKITDHLAKDFNQITSATTNADDEEHIHYTKNEIGANLNKHSEAKKISHDSPVWRAGDFEESLKVTEPKIALINTCYDARGGKKSRNEALERIKSEVIKAIDNGAQRIILEDDINSKFETPIDFYKVTAAVHAHMKKEGKRWDASLGIRSHKILTPHDVTAAYSAGANEIYPIMAYIISEKIAIDKREDVQDRIEKQHEVLKQGLTYGAATKGINILEDYRGGGFMYPKNINMNDPQMKEAFPHQSSTVGGHGSRELCQNEIAIFAVAIAAEDPKALLEIGDGKLFNPGSSKFWKETQKLFDNQFLATYGDVGITEFVNRIDSGQYPKELATTGIYAYKAKNAEPKAWNPEFISEKRNILDKAAKELITIGDRLDQYFESREKIREYEKSSGFKSETTLENLLLHDDQEKLPKFIKDMAHASIAAGRLVEKREEAINEIITFLNETTGKPEQLLHHKKIAELIMDSGERPWWLEMQYPKDIENPKTQRWGQGKKYFEEEINALGLPPELDALWDRQLRYTKENPFQPHDLLEINRDKIIPVALEDMKVTTAEVMRRNHMIADMSVGSIGFETPNWVAYNAYALTLSMSGGEGAQDRRRDPEGPYSSTNTSSKQTASNRYGVNAHYAISIFDNKLTCAIYKNGELIDSINPEQVLKASQPAKPGKPGVLGGNKVTKDVARQRGVYVEEAQPSTSNQENLFSIEEMAKFVEAMSIELREKHGIDFKKASVTVKITCDGKTEEFVTIGIAKALVKAGIPNGAIEMGGDKGGTGNANLTDIMYGGTNGLVGMRKAHLSLAESGFRNEGAPEYVKLYQSGDALMPYDFVMNSLNGADGTKSGKYTLEQVGCVGASTCDKDCPANIATNNEFYNYPQLLAQLGTIYNAIKMLKTFGELGFDDDRKAIGQLHKVFKAPEEIRARGEWNLEPILQEPNYKPVNKEPAENKFGAVPHPDHGVIDIISGNIDSPALKVIHGGENPAIHLAVKVNNKQNHVGRDISAYMADQVAVSGNQWQVTKNKTRVGKPVINESAIKIEYQGIPGDYAGIYNYGHDVRFEGVNCHALSSHTSGVAVIAPTPDYGDYVPHHNSVAENGTDYGAWNGETVIWGNTGDRTNPKRHGGTFIHFGSCGDNYSLYQTKGSTFHFIPKGGHVGSNYGYTTGGIIVTYDSENLVDKKLSAKSKILTYQDLKSNELTQKVADGFKNAILESAEFFIRHTDNGKCSQEPEVMKELIKNIDKEIDNFKFVVPEFMYKPLSNPSIEGLQKLRKKITDSVRDDKLSPLDAMLKNAILGEKALDKQFGVSI